MEETTGSNQPPASAPLRTGKGLSITGFVISLVALLLWYSINKAALLIAAFSTAGVIMGAGWMALSLLGLIFSAAGMKKAQKSGGKAGLAIAGLVIAIVAVGLSACTVYWAREVHEEVSKLGQEFLNAFSNGVKEAADSLHLEDLNGGAAPADSTGH